MIRIDSPGWGIRNIEHLVLDFNGTVALDGHMLGSVDEALAKLSIQLRIHLCTADFHGTAAQETRRYEMALKILKEPNRAQEKAEFVRRLGPMSVAAIGNGNADALMIKEAALGIAVIGQEGVSGPAIASADVVCVDIASALNLFLRPQRLAATLQR